MNLTLTFLCGIVNRKHVLINHPFKMLSLSDILLLFIPFLSIVGAYLRNAYEINILLMFSIFMISLIPLFVVYDKIPRSSYPLAVFIISVSLLFHTSLVGDHVWGWDIQHEYYLSDLVIKHGIWDSSIPDNYNAMLSVVMIAPIFSIFCKISLVWVFKVIYPFIFAFVPLALYQFFKKQVDEKLAFFSTFFFMASGTFCTEMTQLARQQIAELFLALLLLVMVNEEITKKSKALFFIIFSFSLVVSHYGLSYIFMLMLFSSCFILVIVRSPLKFSEKLQLSEKFKGFYSHLKDQYIKNDLIKTTFVFLFFTFALTWYMYVSSSSIFITIIKIGNQITSSIFTEFLSPSAVQGLAELSKKQPTFLHEIGRYIRLLTQFFIIAGILVFVRNKKIKFNNEYVVLSYVAFFICLLAIAVPYFSSAINTTRLYQITLFFLAPFCIIGGISIFSRLKYLKTNPYTPLSIILGLLLLFNIGWIYTVLDERPSSFALNPKDDAPYFNYEEIQGAKWITHNMDRNKYIYADEYRKLIFLSIRPENLKYENIHSVPSNGSFNDGYLYIGKKNILNKIMVVYRREGVLNKIINISLSSLTSKMKNRIYDSGFTIIYKK